MSFPQDGSYYPNFSYSVFDAWPVVGFARVREGASLLWSRAHLRSFAKCSAAPLALGLRLNSKTLVGFVAFSRAATHFPVSFSTRPPFRVLCQKTFVMLVRFCSPYEGRLAIGQARPRFPDATTCLDTIPNAEDPLGVHFLSRKRSRRLWRQAPLPLSSSPPF